MDIKSHENSFNIQTSDPWSVHVISPENKSVNVHFENNFTPIEQQTKSFQPLPDTEEYLQCLERKLDKLKNWSKSDQSKGRQIIDQLCDARRTCLENLVDSNHIIFEQDHSDLQPSGLSSWINPEQPLSYVETQRLI